MLHFNI
jgi:septal ring factor EnvC (AmiA/AmiB activator)